MKWYRTFRRALVAALLAATAACYASLPLENAVPAPATRVLAQLTDSGTVVMGGLIGSGATEVEGLVAAADDATWDLQLTRVEHRDGRIVQWSGETVRFPRSVLTGVTEKRIDATRSVIAGGMLAAAAVLASYLFTGAIGDSDTGEPPPPPAARVPVLFPFR
jgi:hypothetical protein